MTTLDYRMRDALPVLGEKGRLTVLIDLLLRCDQLRYRCYPSVKKIAKDTGQSTSVVDAALDWLVSAKAIIKIGYRQRMGAKEKALPSRQTVYQLTGSLCIDGKAYPYLYFNPETRAIVDELIRLSQRHISETEISQSEISDNEISESETEGITSIKGSSKKKDTPTSKSTDLIKAWLDVQGSKNKGAYKNADIKASAQGLFEDGITASDVTAFTTWKKTDKFWADKFVSFEHVANEICGWKSKRNTNGNGKKYAVQQQVAIAQAAAANDMTVDEYLATMEAWNK